MNNNATAAAFICYGLSNATSMSLSADGSFKGCIYAPQALLTINAGSTNTISFSGAIAAKYLSVNGNVNFHYDESLRQTGPFTY